jgi:hypothetical protein
MKQGIEAKIEILGTIFRSIHTSGMKLIDNSHASWPKMPRRAPRKEPVAGSWNPEGDQK